MYNIEAPLFWYKLVFIFELLLAEGLVTYTLKKRSKFALRAVLSVLVMVGVGFAFPILFYNTIYSSVLFTVLFLCSLCALKFCYDEPWFNILFCAILAYTAQHIAYVTCYFFVNVMDLGNFAVYGDAIVGDSNPFMLLVYLASYFLVYWAVWAFVAYRIRKNKNFKLNNFTMLTFSSIILLTDIILNAVVVYNATIISKLLLSVFYVYNVMSCVLAIGILFSMLKNKLLENEVDTIQKLWHKEQELYQLKKENIELINIKCHDLKHRLRSFRKSRNIDADELKEIENTIGIYDSFLKTGNEVLDVVLSEESLYCQKNNIRLICMAEGKELNFINVSDLFSLFNNAVHNAIEAVIKVADPTKREIRLRVVRINNMISIHIENYCDQPDAITFNDGLPQTTKENRDFHGFGVRSMQLVTEKLGGWLDISLEGDVFSLDIVIPVPECPTAGKALSLRENKAAGIRCADEQ